jgi:predicted metal-dependent enzyme (double-stranded beta helix superfamily)
MCDTGYTVKQLVEHLRELKAASTSEEEMLEVVPLLAKRIAGMKHNWLRPYMCVPNKEPGEGAGVYPLHEEDDHSLAVFVVTWMPGDETPPHDHGTWAVIAGLEGHETNHWWKRIDDGTKPGFADIRRAGQQRIDSESCVAMPARAIHSLHNDSDGMSITLHLYGRNVNHTGRFKFDPERHTMSAYRMGGTVTAAPSR